jgi:predicted enzyme related to lactoylglutathione lyase
MHKVATGIQAEPLGPRLPSAGAREAVRKCDSRGRGKVAGMLRIGSIVIRVDDLERQKRFWQAALDYLARPGDGADFALLRPRDGSPGPNVSLDTAPSQVHVPPRIHLDLYADDQTAEVQRLKGLGATEVHWDKRPPDADYVILADPEGNRFCVIDSSR